MARMIATLMRGGVPVRGIVNGAHQLFISATCAQSVFRRAIQPEVDAVLLNQSEKPVLRHLAALKQMQNLADAQRLRVGSGEW